MSAKTIQNAAKGVAKVATLATKAASGDPQAVGKLAMLGVNQISKSAKRRKKKKERQLGMLQSSAQFTAAPLAVGTDVRVVRPMSKSISVNGMAGIEVSGMEVLTPVRYPPFWTSNTAYQESHLWAPNAGLLLLLDNLAKSYARWQPVEFSIHFVPNVSANTSGQIVLWSSMDPTTVISNPDLLVSQRFERNVLTNIWKSSNLDLKQNMEASYLPTSGTTDETANIRQTFGAVFGFTFSSDTPGRVDTDSYQLGTLYARYRVVCYQQESTLSSSTLNFNYQANLLAAQPFPKLRNQIFVQSSNNPRKFKYIGVTREFVVTINAFVDDDLDATTEIPKVFIYDGITPKVGTAVTHSGVTDGSYSHDNLLIANVKYSFDYGDIIELPPDAPANLELNMDFDILIPSGSSLTDF
jgi:hypothetical protein